MPEMFGNGLEAPIAATAPRHICVLVDDPGLDVVAGKCVHVGERSYGKARLNLVRVASVGGRVRYLGYVIARHPDVLDAWAFTGKFTNEHGQNAHGIDGGDTSAAYEHRYAFSLGNRFSALSRAMA
jgi:hypothetical protein